MNFIRNLADGIRVMVYTGVYTVLFVGALVVAWMFIHLIFTYTSNPEIWIFSASILFLLGIVITIAHSQAKSKVEQEKRLEEVVTKRLQEYAPKINLKE